MFLEKCKQSRKRRKRSKIDEKAKKETEAKKTNLNLVAEKSFKLSSKSGGKLIHGPTQKTTERDPCSKWLFQIDSTILDSTSKPNTILDNTSKPNTNIDSTSKPNTILDSARKNPGTGSKAPPVPSAGAFLVAAKPTLPLKRKGPGRQ